jgi:hypothetical protein
MKRWIVSKRMLTCEVSSCDNYGMDNACRVKKLHEDGTVDKLCKACKTEQRCHYKTDSFKERRACATSTCRHVRDVTVRVWSATLYGVSTSTEHFEKYCDACKLEQSAASHILQARQFQKKAAEIRNRRKIIVDTETPQAST